MVHVKKYKLVDSVGESGFLASETRGKLYSHKAVSVRCALRGATPSTTSPGLLFSPGPQGRTPVTTDGGAGPAVVPEPSLLLWVYPCLGPVGPSWLVPHRVP